MRFHNLFCDPEAHSQAFTFRAGCGAHETLKDRIQMFGRYSDSFVPNGNYRLTIISKCGNRNRLLKSVFDGVGTQVGDYLINSKPIPRAFDAWLKLKRNRDRRIRDDESVDDLSN